MPSKPTADVGVEPEIAFQSRAPYYLITQVHGSPVVRRRLRGRLLALALGQRGAQVIVPAAAPLIAGIAVIAAYVALRPLKDPSEIPDVRILAGWDDLSSKVVRWADDLEEPFTEVEQVPGAPDVVEAVKNIGHLIRPELSDNELHAGADVIAAEIDADGDKTVQPVDPDEIHRSRQKVEAAIQSVRSTSGSHEGTELN